MESQTIDLCDFVSHPRVAIKGGLRDIAEDFDLRVAVALTDDPALPLLNVRGTDSANLQNLSLKTSFYWIEPMNL